MPISTHERLATIETTVKFIERKIDKIASKLEEDYVTRKEFVALESSHYGLRDTMKESERRILKYLVGALTAGSFVWIKESRDAIIHLISAIVGI